MIILYFTATGNSLEVAKAFKDATLVSIPQAIKTKQYHFKNEQIGVVAPIYGWNMTPYVTDFLKKADLECDYLFAILTYGKYAGSAPSRLYQFAQENGINFSYVNQIEMINNYMPVFEMEKQKQQHSKKNVAEHLKLIMTDVQNKKHLIPKMKKGVVAPLIAKSKHFDVGEGVIASFKVNDKCNQCGTCSKVCPLGSIKIIDNRVHFGDACISCLACIHNCPQVAINISRQRSKGRYRNEHVSLAEIIKANQQ